MWRIVIADDEGVIRDGMKTIIPWDEYGFEIVGEASNGLDTLKCIEKLKPEVIITDVKMPLMSGIDLLKEIRRLGMDIKVLLISGYDDFQYVKEGLRYGAVNYLLKPINNEEMIATVKELATLLTNQIYSNIQQRKNMTILKNNTLIRLVTNQFLPNDLKDKLDILQIDLSDGQTCAAVIELDIPHKSDITVGEDKGWETYAALNICDELIEKEQLGIVFLDYSWHVVVIFTNMGSEKFKIIKSVMDNCLINIRNSINTQAVASVGTLSESYRKLYVSYKKAIDTLDYQFIFGKNITLFSDEISQYYQERSLPVDPDLGIISSLVKSKKSEPVVKYIEEYFHAIFQKNIIADQYVLKNIALEILITIYNILSDYVINDRELSQPKERALQKIGEAVNIEDLIECEKEFTIQMMESAFASRSLKYSNLINSVITYLEKNYSDRNLSLQLLSEHMFVNTAYLGRIFKSETGQYFTDYLSNIRIKKAIDFLRDTNYKVVEICEMVGFSNYSYFYTIFKKATGMSPKDLRS
jgi:two-component system, response regulator YesN